MQICNKCQRYAQRLEDIGIEIKGESLYVDGCKREGYDCSNDEGDEHSHIKRILRRIMDSELFVIFCSKEPEFFKGSETYYYNIRFPSDFPKYPLKSLLCMLESYPHHSYSFTKTSLLVYLFENYREDMVEYSKRNMENLITFIECIYVELFPELQFIANIFMSEEFLPIFKEIANLPGIFCYKSGILKYLSDNNQDYSDCYLGRLNYNHELIAFDEIRDYIRLCHSLRITKLTKCATRAEYDKLCPDLNLEPDPDAVFAKPLREILEGYEDFPEITMETCDENKFRILKDFVNSMSNERFLNLVNDYNLDRIDFPRNYYTFTSFYQRAGKMGLLDVDEEYEEIIEAVKNMNLEEVLDYLCFCKIPDKYAGGQILKLGFEDPEYKIEKMVRERYIIEGYHLFKTESEEFDG